MPTGVRIETDHISRNKIIDTGKSGQAPSTSTICRLLSAKKQTEEREFTHIVLYHSHVFCSKLSETMLGGKQQQQTGTGPSLPTHTSVVASGDAPGDCRPTLWRRSHAAQVGVPCDEHSHWETCPDQIHMEPVQYHL